MTIQDAKNWYKAMGLNEVTTPKQKNNGTLMFEDTYLNGIFYTFHKSGYFRRKRVNNTRGYSGYMHHIVEHYQLNRTIQVYDKHWFRYRTQRILVKSIPKQMELAYNAIQHFRKVNK